MALQINRTFPTLQMTVNGIYCRIMNFSGDKDLLSLNIGFYASQSARDNGADPIETKLYHVVFDSTTAINPFVYAYQQLKLNEDFAGAIDV